MKSFLQRFGAFVLGVLGGFDRLRFRGCKRQLCHVPGILSYLGHRHIRLTDFTDVVQEKTIQLCQALQQPAEELGLYRFLNNCQLSKEETALQMAAQQQRTEGLIAVLGCVEPCLTARVRKNHDTKRLEMRVEQGKCKHYYHYYLDPQYGLRYTRLQTWFPYTCHVGLNGRDWLAQQLTAAGMAFQKKDNSFSWVEDFAAAQKLLDEQLRTEWTSLLASWLAQSNPLETTLLETPVPYYWSVETAEYATDIAFRCEADLAAFYPQFVQHAYATLQGKNLLRFMGYRVRQDGKPSVDLSGEVITKIEDLVEGTRVKFEIVTNLLKMYDKFGGILRLENLLRDVRHFKVLRRPEGVEEGPLQYLRMRKGVADLHGRAEAGAKINERLASSLATVADKTSLADLTKDLGKRQPWKGRSVRALNPLAAEDAALLKAVSRGEFAISGFRNGDIRKLLNGAAEDGVEQKRQAAKVTRQLRMLRGHGLIQKISKTHRYQLTEKGRRNLSALLAARNANTEQLLQAA
jgi:hypothetical protein